MRMPDPGPFGDTFLEARDRAMVEALFVNSSFGGCVESVLTVFTHFFGDDFFAAGFFFLEDGV
jgi:hypothetical protein